MHNFGIIYSDKTVYDYEAIRFYNTYILGKYERGEQIVDKIENRIRKLSESPYYQMYDYEREVRKIIEGEYKIFYRIHEDQNIIEILRILHFKQDQKNNV